MIMEMKRSVSETMFDRLLDASVNTLSANVI